MPVGRVAPVAGATMAVRVTSVPWLACVGLAVSVVVVVMVCVESRIVTEITLDEDVASAESPEYTALRLSVPTGRAEVVKIAAPDDSVTDPREVEPT